MKLVSAIILLFASQVAVAQTDGKLSKEEASRMTQEQRVVHESDRKSKHGKKDLTLKKKIRISKEMDRKSRKMHQPRTRVRTKSEHL